MTSEERNEGEHLNSQIQPPSYPLPTKPSLDSLLLRRRRRRRHQTNPLATMAHAFRVALSKVKLLRHRARSDRVRPSNYVKSS